MPLPVTADSEQIRGRHFAGLFLFCFAPHACREVTRPAAGLERTQEVNQILLLAVPEPVESVDHAIGFGA
jgi:hypothetical protein